MPPDRWDGIISNNQEKDEKADDCLWLVAIAAADNPGTPLAIRSRSGIPLRLAVGVVCDTNDVD